LVTHEARALVIGWEKTNFEPIAEPAYSMEPNAVSSKAFLLTTLPSTPNGDRNMRCGLTAGTDRVPSLPRSPVGRISELVMSSRAEEPPLISGAMAEKV
jgi:hypothetical protein